MNVEVYLALYWRSQDFLKAGFFPFQESSKLTVLKEGLDPWLLGTENVDGVSAGAFCPQKKGRVPWSSLELSGIIGFDADRKIGGCVSSNSHM